MNRVCGEASGITILCKEFRVFCVTKRSSPEQEKRMKDADIVNVWSWYESIRGTVTVEVIGVQMGDTQVPADIKITFNNQSCELLHFRTGLSDCVHTIVIRALEAPEYNDEWELYTSELTEKGIEKSFDPDDTSVWRPHTTQEGGMSIYAKPDPAYPGADAQPLTSLKACD